MLLNFFNKLERKWMVVRDENCVFDVLFYYKFELILNNLELVELLIYV